MTSEFNLPDMPDDDADFTPEVARKIIGKYRDLIVSLRRQLDEARDKALEDAAMIVDGFQVPKYPVELGLRPRRYPSQTSIMIAAAIRSLKDNQP